MREQEICDLLTDLNMFIDICNKHDGSSAFQFQEQKKAHFFRFQIYKNIVTLKNVQQNYGLIEEKPEAISEAKALIEKLHETFASHISRQKNEETQEINMVDQEPIVLDNIQLKMADIEHSPH